ncbi:hypothetical protein AWB67_06405 [Caballeronia terrestris]|uniref:DUF3396 domain-containing protein n=1 Tax=Caballeronia terrestris TaxID=1226301 RepID=A0A158KSM1_9BURK|nr:type VI immunity family protein [Caballeronia terrestris]SAL83431.1 hypothetical protein AWB67_06405 [Caballeronia terrestris]
MNLPPQLSTPFIASGRVACKVMLDLTVYLVGPTEAELEYLIDLYSRACPRDRLIRYKISELEYWPALSNPVLTKSGRLAAANGTASPALEPVRQRIRTGRAFEVRFWDGNEIDAPDGSWSFSCTGLKLRRSGLHAFARILVPLATSPALLFDLARAIARNVRFLSGHGGLVFVYHPWHKAPAFDYIFAAARRFWCVDIEDLNVSLPLMRDGIKSINWITMIGQLHDRLVETDATRFGLERAPEGVVVHKERLGYVVIIGPAPTTGDINRPGPQLRPYFEFGERIAPLVLTQHPDFDGASFFRTGSTVGWIRRFVDPQGWR